MAANWPSDFSLVVVDAVTYSPPNDEVSDLVYSPGGAIRKQQRRQKGPTTYNVVDARTLWSNSILTRQTAATLNELIFYRLDPNVAPVLVALFQQVLCRRFVVSQPSC